MFTFFFKSRESLFIALNIIGDTLNLYSSTPLMSSTGKRHVHLSMEIIRDASQALFTHNDINCSGIGDDSLEHIYGDLHSPELAKLGLVNKQLHFHYAFHQPIKPSRLQKVLSLMIQAQNNQTLMNAIRERHNSFTIPLMEYSGKYQFIDNTTTPILPTSELRELYTNYLSYFNNNISTILNQINRTTTKVDQHQQKQLEHRRNMQQHTILIRNFMLHFTACILQTGAIRLMINSATNLGLSHKSSTLLLGILTTGMMIYLDNYTMLSLSLMSISFASKNIEIISVATFLAITLLGIGYTLHEKDASFTQILGFGFLHFFNLACSHVTNELFDTATTPQSTQLANRSFVASSGATANTDKPVSSPTTTKQIKIN